MKDLKTLKNGMGCVKDADPARSNKNNVISTSDEDSGFIKNDMSHIIKKEKNRIAAQKSRKKKAENTRKLEKEAKTLLEYNELARKEISELEDVTCFLIVFFEKLISHDIIPEEYIIYAEKFYNDILKVGLTNSARYDQASLTKTACMIEESKKFITDFLWNKKNDIKEEKNKKDE